MGVDSLPQAHVTTKPAGFTKKVFALFSKSSYQEIESCVEERKTQGDKHRVPRENAPLAAFRSPISRFFGQGLRMTVAGRSWCSRLGNKQCVPSVPDFPSPIFA